MSFSKNDGGDSKYGLNVSENRMERGLRTSSFSCATLKMPVCATYKILLSDNYHQSCAAYFAWSFSAIPSAVIACSADHFIFFIRFLILANSARSSPRAIDCSRSSSITLHTVSTPFCVSFKYRVLSVFTIDDQTILLQLCMPSLMYQFV